MHWELCKVLLQLCLGRPVAHKAQACLGGQLLQDVPEHLEVLLCTMHEVHVEAFWFRLLQRPDMQAVGLRVEAAETPDLTGGLTDCSRVQQCPLWQPA